MLKLFHDWFSLEDIQYEQRMAQAVHAAGLPVPAAGEIIQVAGHSGLVYERVEAVDMWSDLQRRPLRLFRYARLAAELHAGMHATPAPEGIPSQRRRLQRKLEAASALPPALKTELLRRLDDLPDGDRFCHGDFHPGNILVPAGGAVVIDWIDATRGSPLADLARSSVIILGAASSSQIPGRALQAMVRVFHTLYLRRYFALRPGGRETYRRWIPVVAAARLSEDITELETWLLTQAAKP